MNTFFLFRTTITLLFAIFTYHTLFAEGDFPGPPLPNLSPEDETELPNEGSDDNEDTPIEENTPTSLALIDYSSFFNHYDWSTWDERIATWYSNCHDAALMTPPLPLGTRMHHALGVEEVFPPFDELCPNLEAIVVGDIQTWQVRVEEHINAEGERSFWTLIGNVIVHKLPSPMTFNPTNWICSLYEDNLPTWLFEDEEQTTEWLSIRDRSRLAITLTILPTGMLSTYTTVMIELAEAERVKREEAQQDPTAFAFTRIDVSDKDVFFEFYNPLNVRLNLLTRVRLDEPWALFGEVGETSSLGYTSITFPRQEKNDPPFFRIVDAVTDTDGDGLADGLELNYFKSDPTKQDSSGSGISDWDKVYVYKLDPSVRDSDGDGLIDGEEIHIGTNPQVADSDGDGLNDAEEVNSLQPAVAFTWIPITASVLTNPTTESIEIILPSAVSFAGHLYDKVIIDTMGKLTLSHTSIGDSVDELIISGHSNHPYLSIDAESDILFEATTFNDAPCFVFSFVNLLFDDERKSSNHITFQIVLSSMFPNRVWINYLDIGKDKWNNGAIAQIQNKTKKSSITFPYPNEGTLTTQISLEGRFGYGTNPHLPDSDADGLLDDVEIKEAGSSPLIADTDKDSLSDSKEFCHYHTSPVLIDTDGDTLPDAWEIQHGLDPCSTNGNHGRLGDPDGDQLPNELEMEHQTSPTLVDSDRDGLSDSREVGQITTENVNEVRSGTVLHSLSHSSNADSLVATFSLPSAIRFNTTSYSKILISLDGHILLFNDDENFSELSYSNIKLTGLKSCATALIIAAFWDDLYYFGNKTRITLEETEDSYLVRYQNVGLYDFKSNQSVVGTFVITLPKNANPSISITYSNFSSSFTCQSATIGVRTASLSRDIGHKVYQYTFNQAVALNNTTVNFLIGSGTDPNLSDTDNDGILDSEELAINTSPFSADDDLDGLPDGWEIQYSLNPKSASGNHGANGDLDGDFLRNLDEYRAGSSPLHSDTDNDGLLDIQEFGGVALQYNASWISTPSSMTNITSQFKSTSTGYVTIDCSNAPFQFLNTNYTTMSINLNGRIDLFNDDVSPSGLATKGPKDYYTCESQQNHILLAPASGDLFLSSSSSILYGETVLNGTAYVVVEYQQMGDYWNNADFANHQISAQILIPRIISPIEPIIINYKDVAGNLSQERLSVGFTTPTHSKGRGFVFSENRPLSSPESVALFLGLGTSASNTDSDCDGISDGDEYNYGTNAIQPDTDGDGLSDGWEMQHAYNPLVHNETDTIVGNEKDADPDEDGLTNQEEESFKTDPTQTDSDGDGVSDKTEIDQCSHPMDAQDEGIPMTYYPVTFEFGDWSTSHSEKYYLIIRPLGEAASNESKIGWVNLEYGQVETKIALLKKGTTYEVSLTHASSNQSEPDLDYTLNIKSPNGSGLIITDTITSPLGAFAESEWDSSDRLFKLTLAGGDIYCDINRDGQIEQAVDGIATRSGKKVLHHWSNDDYDVGDCSDDKGATDIPKGNQSIFNGNDLNYRDGTVNGRADLLDFVPLWFDIADLINACPMTQDYTYTLSSTLEVGIVFTELAANDVFSWQTSDVITYDKQGDETPSHEASVYTIDDAGLELNQTLLNHLTTGIVMLEGNEPGEGELKLTVLKDDILISEIAFQFKIVEVENMYRTIDITSMPHTVAKPSAPTGLADSYFAENTPYLFFLHGFNVTPNTARGWQAEMFKRLWQTGCDMKFVGVTWFGEEGVFEAFHYQENVRNALLSGESFAALMSHYSQDKTVVMAHSLGNMVVSSALQFYGATCDTFMMLNAAIPSEAFGATVSNADEYVNCFESEQLFVLESWHSYPCKSWSVNWHKLFTENEKESALTWRDIFKDILTKTTVCSFYSSEDELFELHHTVPSMLSGTEFDLAWPYIDWTFPYLHLLSSIRIEVSRYAWHKQEVFKGMNGIIGTKGGGWSFHCRERGFKVYPTGDDARNATDTRLRTRPVFSTRETPFLSNASQYSDEEYFTLLALHMPALTPAMGRPENATFSDVASLNSIDMITVKNNGWGREHFEYKGRWLHSDVKDMAYFYVHELFQTLNSLVKRSK